LQWSCAAAAGASLSIRSGAEGGRIDLHQTFQRVQEQMLANLNASRVYDHYGVCGAVSERQWIELLHRYLPDTCQNATGPRARS